MSLIDKVKALFEAQEPVIMAETIFVKTEDGKIFLVKSPTLALDAEIVMVDEAGTEQPIENGDYILEDKSTLSILDGKIAEIATAEEEVADEEAPVEASEVKMAIIKQVSKWAYDIDQDAIEVGTILTTTYVNDAGELQEPLPIGAGEYENEAGDKVQVDSEGKVVLITKAGTEEVPATEEAPVEQMSAITNLENRIKELELAIEAKDNEVKVAKEAFDKLKSQPAVKPINVKKFEKEVTPSKTNKGNDMLNRVINITNKK